MKVVLFCGGFGMRLREYSEAVPKPMVTIGYRPIMWHIMKYYAHFGHKDFILCLGWKAATIKEYFLNYNECLSNDFVLSSGGNALNLLGSDIHDWTITFVDTGPTTIIGQRLKAVEPYLKGEETFLANYADGLTDLHLPELIDFHHRRNADATFLSVRPTQSFHSVMADASGRVRSIQAVTDGGMWMNGGYFVLNRRIFECLKGGEELIEEPFRRLIAERRLATLRHTGFWCCMDTYKEKQTLDDMHARGDTPWEIWKRPASPVCPVSIATGAVPVVVPT